IALARVDIAHAEVGTEVEIGKLDGHQKRLPARIVTLSHYDPKKTRPQSSSCDLPALPARAQQGSVENILIRFSHTGFVVAAAPSAQLRNGPARRFGRSATTNTSASPMRDVTGGGVIRWISGGL